MLVCELGPPSGRTVISQCNANLCYERDSCSRCLETLDCLWCPSLSRCLANNSHVYPSTFTFGQCLGWVGKGAGTCARESCEDHTNCSSCQSLLHCGWCNDPSDTGRGACVPGGFRAPVGNGSMCRESTGVLGRVNETSGDRYGRGDWQFDVCSGKKL